MAPDAWRVTNDLAALATVSTMNEGAVTAIVIICFLVVGGVFVAAELALVSLREGQVARLSERGRRGKTLARLVANPNRFLAAAQIGVTLAAFFTAAFGESRLSPLLTPTLESWGVSSRVAEPLVFIGVTVFLSYLALVFGELVPKRLALQRTESIAYAVAGPIDFVARIARPFVWLLSLSTDLVVRLLGGDPKAGKEAISGEELRGIVASHGALSHEERELIDDVFSAGNRELKEVMIPRTEVEFLDGSLPVSKAARLVAGLPHSRYPVVRDSPDEVIGFVHVRDLLAPDMVERSIRVEELARDVARLPDTKGLIPALTSMRRDSHHLAIVVDEYGGTAGIVTLEDLVEELIGDIRDEYDVDEVDTGTQLHGDRTLDGLCNLEDFTDEFSIELPDGPYETVAGFMGWSLGRLAVLGDTVIHDRVTLTVADMDGRRISRVQVRIAAPVQNETEDGSRGAPQ